jgi:DNA-binding GntR family transcriptional regulator
MAVTPRKLLGTGEQKLRPAGRAKLVVSEPDEYPDSGESGDPGAEPSARGRMRQGRTVLDVRDRLRDAILSGALPPSTPLSTVQLAAEYGVSRTPLREALRMLEEEGLLASEGNRRSRVATMSSDQLETVYAERLLLGFLGTYLTVSKMDRDDVDNLDQLFRGLKDAADRNDFALWHAADHAFHAAHTSQAPTPLREELERLRVRSDYFATLWVRNRPFRQPSSTQDHRLILEACRDKDPAGAARAAANHLARVALSVMSDIEPAKEPATIRTALSMVLQPSLLIGLGEDGGRVRS